MKIKLKLNLIFALLLQVVTIICNLIIPRQILLAFGSDVNGLISSLTQFLNYISLIEGGIGSVIMTNLYKPLANKDSKVLSRVVITANNFFRKIAKIFILYLFALAILYPIFIKTDFSYKYIASLTLILGISLFVQYYFSITWRLLLQADAKVYISSAIQIVVILLNTILTYIAIKVYPNIHFVKILASLAFILQPLCYEHFIKKYYNLEFNLDSDLALLGQRWDGFGINLAAFLNGNTDVLVLTFFTSLKDVSIYGIYNLVAMGIKSIITSFSAGITPSLGRYYAAKDKKALIDIFNKYELLIFYLSFSIYVSAMILIVPFVLNYTKGIDDANYSRELFAIFLLSSFMMFCLREPYVNMSYVANSYKRISKYAYVEAVLNIIFSLIFVYKFGLSGVAFGTLISMIYRTLMQVWYLKNNILYRKFSIFITNILSFTLTSVIAFLICKKFIIYIDLNWFSWIVYAIFVSVIVFLLNIISVILISMRNKKYV